jgi:hypothetical protein
MELLTLGAKSALAMMLLVAGGAKLADLASFTATMRMFAPHPVPRPVVGGGALAVALAEVTAGAVSLSAPGARWVNPAIFVLACVFVVVSAVGYAFFRGRSCRCFGALSQRKFDAWGMARAAAIVAVAAVAMIGVRPAAVQIQAAAQVALLAAAILLVVTAFTAARALSMSNRTESRLTTR